MASGIYYFANVVTQLDTPLQAGKYVTASRPMAARHHYDRFADHPGSGTTYCSDISARQAAASSSRERGVEVKAMRNAYVVLAAGVLMSFGTVFFNVSVFVMSHILLLFFVLAELTKYASQLLHYRHTV